MCRRSILYWTVCAIFLYFVAGLLHLAVDNKTLIFTVPSWWCHRRRSVSPLFARRQSSLRNHRICGCVRIQHRNQIMPLVKLVPTQLTLILKSTCLWALQYGFFVFTNINCFPLLPYNLTCTLLYIFFNIIQSAFYPHIKTPFIITISS